MDQMEVSLVKIKQGSKTIEFVKVPDSDDPNEMYNAPPGKALKLVLEDDDTFLLKNGNGTFCDFDSDGRLSQWSDAHGNVVDYTYTNGRLTQVACKIGGTTTSRTLSFTYTGDHITTVTDSANRSISYTYDGDDNLIEFTNLDGYDYTFDYDDVNDGQLIEVYSPIDSENPILTNVYNTLGQLIQQVDVNDNAYDYYRAYYRDEMLEPEQTDPNNVTKRFSIVSWSNPGNRTIILIDQLGRETVAELDGRSRLSSSISPFGKSKKYTYDLNNNVINKSSISVPGSGDPNISTSKDYYNYINNEGRWFVLKKEGTDPNSSKTYYEYDFNDIQTYGTQVGNLMKITNPQVDSPYDTNTPVIQFTYNSYGQVETTTDPEGMVTKCEYYGAAAGADVKKTIVDYGGGGHLNITTECTYDSVGRVATIKDPRGNITQSEYYDSGLLKKTTAPSPFGYETIYEYYADGKPKKVKQQVSDEGGGGGGLGLTGWSYRKKITIDHSNVDSNLSDFPLYVYLNPSGSGSGLASKIRDDGYDIRFTQADGETVLYYERESYSEASGNSTGHFWIKVPTISSSSTTDIYMYYGKSDASDGSDSSNVWTTDYQAVWHMAEDDWDGTSGEVVDSIGSNDGVRGGDATTTATNAKIYRCGTFDGTGDYVNFGTMDIGDGTGDKCTISLWWYSDGFQTSYDRLVSKATGTSAGAHWWMLSGSGTQLRVRLKLDGTTTTQTSDTGYMAETAWIYTSMVYDGSNIIYYKNGASFGASDSASGDVSVDNTVQAWAAANPTGADNPFDGLIDEVRITNDARTAAEIKFEYYNMSESDQELSWGSEENDEGGGGDAAMSTYIEDEESSQMATTVYGEGTVTFYWKVSSEEGYDYLEFYIDGVRQDRISGEVDWHQRQYDITGSGSHYLFWQYIKDGSSEEGDDCGYVDYLQWTGATEPQGWQKITYTYDPSGRRIEKTIDDDETTKYFYDGGSVIAEYDGNNNLLRKYIYGPGGPVCMIDVADSNSVYYYHYDGVGSVVALSDSAGDTVQTYEYSIYGIAAAEDPNHPNPYMCAGMWFDIETGLYYRGGPVYNPYIARMLQQNFGIHWQRYAYNNHPLTANAEEIDAESFNYDGWGILDPDDPEALGCAITFARFVGGVIVEKLGFDSWDEWETYAKGLFDFNNDEAMEEVVGWKLSGRDSEIFMDIFTLLCLGYNWTVPHEGSSVDFKTMVQTIEGAGVTVEKGEKLITRYNYNRNPPVVEWNHLVEDWYNYYGDKGYNSRGHQPQQQMHWNKFPPLVLLAHEIAHAYDDYDGTPLYGYYRTYEQKWTAEQYAMKWENVFRYMFYRKKPGYEWVRPRPAYGYSDDPYNPEYQSDYHIWRKESAYHPDITWGQYWAGFELKP